MVSLKNLVANALVKLKAAQAAKAEAARIEALPKPSIRPWNPFKPVIPYVRPGINYQPTPRMYVSTSGAIKTYMATPQTPLPADFSNYYYGLSPVLPVSVKPAVVPFTSVPTPVAVATTTVSLGDMLSGSSLKKALKKVEAQRGVLNSSPKAAAKTTRELYDEFVQTTNKLFDKAQSIARLSRMTLQRPLIPPYQTWARLHGYVPDYAPQIRTKDVVEIPVTLKGYDQLSDGCTGLGADFFTTIGKAFKAKAVKAVAPTVSKLTGVKLATVTSKLQKTKLVVSKKAISKAVVKVIGGNKASQTGLKIDGPGTNSSAGTDVHPVIESGVEHQSDESDGTPATQNGGFSGSTFGLFTGKGKGGAGSSVVPAYVLPVVGGVLVLSVIYFVAKRRTA